MEGAESARRDETPWPIYDGPLANARLLAAARQAEGSDGELKPQFLAHLQCAEDADEKPGMVLALSVSLMLAILTIRMLLTSAVDTRN